MSNSITTFIAAIKFYFSTLFFNILKKTQRFCITTFFRPRSQKPSKTRPFCHSRPEKSWRKPKHGLAPVLCAEPAASALPLTGGLPCQKSLPLPTLRDCSHGGFLLRVSVGWTLQSDFPPWREADSMKRSPFRYFAFLFAGLLAAGVWNLQRADAAEGKPGRTFCSPSPTIGGG